jgi:hypothetical protein
MREESMLKDSFKLSVHRVFQSLGLCPIITDSDPTGTFVTYQGPTTPGTVRKGLLLANSVLAEAEETWNLRENRTIGGLMVGIEMRGEADDILDSVVDPAPLAVEIDDSESDSDEDNDEDSDSDKGGRKG